MQISPNDRWIRTVTSLTTCFVIQTKKNQVTRHRITCVNVFTVHFVMTLEIAVVCCALPREIIHSPFILLRSAYCKIVYTVSRVRVDVTCGNSCENLKLGMCCWMVCKWKLILSEGKATKCMCRRDVTIRGHYFILPAWFVTRRFSNACGRSLRHRADGKW